jgi:hypothetical protein
MLLMRLLAALILAAVMYHAPLNAQVHIIKGSIQKSFRTVTKDGRSVQIEQQSLEASVVAPGSAEISQVDIVMLYDRQSKLFWWHYQLGEPRDQPDEMDKFLADSALYILGNKIVCFTFLTGPGSPFWVAESSAPRTSRL